MANWLLDLFTIAHLGYFILGAGSATVYNIVKARIQGRIVVIRWQYMALPLVVGVVAYTAVQSQANANCVREFNQALRVRAQITGENDRLSIAQRELIYDWIHALVFPPPNIAELPGSDPRREKWAINLTLETDKRFRESIEQQRANDQARAENPLPEPTCGL